MEREEIEKKAFNYFQSGFNCAEAISKTITEFFSKEPAVDIPKVATGFGGAIGGTKCEATCGAVGGGLIALGFLFGRMKPGDDKKKIYDLASEFRSLFIDKFGSTNCQTILNGFGVQENMLKCKRLTADAAGMLYDILPDEIKESEKEGHMSIQDESLVGCCGMFCGDCIVRTGHIAEIANSLLQKVKSDEFKTLATGLPKVLPIYSKLSFYGQFCDFLSLISHLSCEKCCKEGGGIPNCAIRNCCQEKAIDGCWTCGDFKDCEKIAWLCQIHPDAPIKNLTKIKEFGIEEYLKGEKYF